MDEKINKIEKKLKSLDDKLSLALNKLDKLGKQRPSAVTTPVKIDRAEPQVSQQKVEKLLLGSVKVFGNIVNKSMQPLSGVQVKMYDNSSELIKDVKSDDNGYWEVRLPHGRYGVEYIHKNFKPVNKTIEIDKKDKIYEVR